MPIIRFKCKISSGFFLQSRTQVEDPSPQIAIQHADKYVNDITYFQNLVTFTSIMRSTFVKVIKYYL
jgi:hypothetical protein